MAIYGSLGEVNLASLSASISDTAVDIFIYDTSKDSDGGAWRKRTQHTSWYNETLGTATRGTRREFPAVAVIVAESNQVTIYDGDDPDLPMWMVFNGLSYQYMIRSGTNCISALNGILCVGNVSNHGLIRIEFIADRSKLSHSSGDAQRYFKGNISQRNSTNDYDYGYPALWDPIVNGNVNDVAMTVLPNAPIDDATGLPIPTIAVATDGGVSVIKDDGTVISSTTNVGYPIKEISIFSSGELYHRQGSGSNEGICFNYPYTRISGIDLGTYANSSSFWYASQGVGNLSNYLGYSSVAPNAINNPNSLSLNIGDNRGLTFVDVNKGSDVASHSSSSTYSLNNGMVAYATTSYNTGWMHGDIKGAFLSDTDTTNVTGTELITNGDFSSSLGSEWQANNSSGSVHTFSIVSGELEVVRGNASVGYGEPYQAFSTVVGKTYVITFTTTSGNQAYQCGTSIGGTQYFNQTSTVAGTTYSRTFTATSTTGYITIIPDGANTTARTDNVSVRISELDRSVNNNGLQVFGTVTKSAVATAAELVAYSDWSSSNYLQQPYNGFLNVGTGDYCFMGWIYSTNFTGTQMILGSDDGGGNIRKVIGYLNGSGQLVNHINGFGNNISLTATSAFSNNVWSYFVFGRKGGTQYTYINGELNTSGSTNTENISFSTNSTPFAIGYCPREAMTAFNGSLSLIRASVTFPSPEQIKKIYEDEKVLFQENAACTLYGSSDAVTSLAYDEDYETLYVGTSSGRSDFRGLRRINKTTTAVTTAISASNGLIAEQ